GERRLSRAVETSAVARALHRMLSKRGRCREPRAWAPSRESTMESGIVVDQSTAVSRGTHRRRARLHALRRAERHASGLAWLGIGLGMAELIAPGRLARFLGLDDQPSTRTLLRAFGVREIASSIAVLARARHAGWMWARVLGDALDLAALATAHRSARRRHRPRVRGALVFVLAASVLDLVTASRLARAPRARIPGL